VSSDPSSQPPESQPPLDADLRPARPDEAEQLDPANEKDLWQGRQSMKTMYPTLVFWLLLVLIVVGFSSYQWAWTGFNWSAIVMVILLILLVSRTLWKIAATSYRITTQRLFIRRGILSQSVDQTELLRVDDVKMTQSLLERVLGIGSVEISSSDRSDGFLALRGIAEPATVAEHIRRHTRMVQGKRTLFMESL
jgi:uncharacterized membrane protein YdbT with pleckstrin-like domain